MDETAAQHCDPEGLGRAIFSALAPTADPTPARNPFLVAERELIGTVRRAYAGPMTLEELRQSEEFCLGGGALGQVGRSREGMEA